MRAPQGRRVEVVPTSRHRALQHAQPGESVYQRMMHLEVDSETVFLKALDYVVLPQRAIEVHRIAVQSRDQHAEFTLSARVRQRRVPHVVLQIEVIVFLPHR